MPQIRYEHWCTLCIRPSMHDTKESQVCPRCRCSRTECKESK